MRPGFNLSKYGKDRKKSYDFCQKRKSLEDDDNVQLQQGKKMMDNMASHFRGDFSIKMLRISEECDELDVLDCCSLPKFKRTKPECKVCLGNV